jgi:LDH2 family malate/lactate/ureidoglycolate dehydrogenase
MATVPIDQLRAALEARGRELGFDDPRAARLADHFLDAEMRGARGHGVERMRWLHGREATSAGARPELTERHEGLARYHAAGTIGYLALAEALDAELADPPDGARLVVVADCFPTGRLGYYAEAAAATGLLALVTATSTPRIVHPEGGPAVLGTNPLCVGLPGSPPTIVDVSMGAITYGAVLTAAAAGRPLDPGAALRPDGSHELDPGEITANRAGIAPFGAEQSYKGFAVALLVELLCGALAGLDGHAAVVLLARPAADAATPLRKAMTDRHVPGEGSRARLEAARAAGVLDLPDDLWAWISPG